ncbi:hypothetical protein [Pseudomonas sp. 18173]|uniref:hypothetical protein n=1 Tax=Pseudomonas sp. 18173 TaxID=3390055 RepID=UPI003D24BCE7
MPNRSLHFKLFWTALIGTVVVMALLLGSIAYIAYGTSVQETSALVETIVKANAKEVELGAGFTVADSSAVGVDGGYPGLVRRCVREWCN